MTIFAYHNVREIIKQLLKGVMWRGCKGMFLVDYRLVSDADRCDHIPMRLPVPFGLYLSQIMDREHLLGNAIVRRRSETDRSRGLPCHLSVNHLQYNGFTALGPVIRTLSSQVIVRCLASEWLI